MDKIWTQCSYIMIKRRRSIGAVAVAGLKNFSAPRSDIQKVLNQVWIHSNVPKKFWCPAYTYVQMNFWLFRKTLTVKTNRAKQVEFFWVPSSPSDSVIVHTAFVGWNHTYLVCTTFKIRAKKWQHTCLANLSNIFFVCLVWFFFLEVKELLESDQT